MSGCALINFAFKALCSTQSSWHRLSPLPPPTHPKTSSPHPSPLSVYFLCFYPRLSLSGSISITHSAIHTHAYTLSLEILSTVYHLQTQRSIASPGRGAKSIIFDRRSNMYDTEWCRRCCVCATHTHTHTPLNSQMDILTHIGAKTQKRSYTHTHKRPRTSAKKCSCTFNGHHSSGQRMQEPGSHRERLKWCQHMLLRNTCWPSESFQQMRY